jgi:hypothetical protein
VENLHGELVRGDFERTISAVALFSETFLTPTKCGFQSGHLKLRGT